MQTDNHTRHIIGFIYAGANSVDISGPLQVFDTANRLLIESKPIEHTFEHGITPRAYMVETVAAESKPVSLTGGLQAIAHYDFSSMPQPDTLIIPGGQGAFLTAKNTDVTNWLTRIASNTRRLASTCTGAFILAEAGLLDHRSATTHWQNSDVLRQNYPAVNVEEDSIFIKDGGIYSSAGVTSGIDLALALVEEDWGQALALAVAKQMVVFFRRSGGQSQYSPLLDMQAPHPSRIYATQEWILAHLHEPLTLERIAEQANMSPRHLSRLFKRDSGKTAGEFITAARLDAARSLLTASSLTLAQIADEIGLGDSENMRRLFMQYFNTNPSLYRQHFSVGSISNHTCSTQMASFNRKKTDV
jgi:transcriptional regulator GlxA family with amidase domain